MFCRGGGKANVMTIQNQWVNNLLKVMFSPMVLRGEDKQFSLLSYKLNMVLLAIFNSQVEEASKLVDGVRQQSSVICQANIRDD